MDLDQWKGRMFKLLYVKWCVRQTGLPLHNVNIAVISGVSQIKYFVDVPAL